MTLDDRYHSQAKICLWLALLWLVTLGPYGLITGQWMPFLSIQVGNVIGFIIWPPFWHWLEGRKERKHQRSHEAW